MMQNECRRHPLAAAFLLVAAVAGGCTGEPEQPVDTLPRVAVSGTVTFEGKPLPGGKIQFQPIGSGPAVMAVGEIQDGKFSIDRPSGPTPGKYRVMISSRPAPKFKENEPSGPPGLEKETIPKKYNLQSKLEVDVAPEGPSMFDFPLVHNP